MNTDRQAEKEALTKGIEYHTNRLNEIIAEEQAESWAAEVSEFKENVDTVMDALFEPLEPGHGCEIHINDIDATFEKTSGGNFLINGADAEAARKGYITLDAFFKRFDGPTLLEKIKAGIRSTLEAKGDRFTVKHEACEYSFALGAGGPVPPVGEPDYVDKLAEYHLASINKPKAAESYPINTKRSDALPQCPPVEYKSEAAVKAAYEKTRSDNESYCRDLTTRGADAMQRASDMTNGVDVIPPHTRDIEAIHAAACSMTAVVEDYDGKSPAEAFEKEFGPGISTPVVTAATFANLCGDSERKSKWEISQKVQRLFNGSTMVPNAMPFGGFWLSYFTGDRIVRILNTDGGVVGSVNLNKDLLFDEFYKMTESTSIKLGIPEPYLVEVLGAVIAEAKRRAEINKPQGSTCRCVEPKSLLDKIKDGIKTTLKSNGRSFTVSWGGKDYSFAIGSGGPVPPMRSPDYVDKLAEYHLASITPKTATQVMEEQNSARDIGMTSARCGKPDGYVPSILVLPNTPTGPFSSREDVVVGPDYFASRHGETKEEIAELLQAAADNLMAPPSYQCPVSNIERVNEELQLEADKVRKSVCEMNTDELIEHLKSCGAKVLTPENSFCPEENLKLLKAAAMHYNAELPRSGKPTKKHTTEEYCLCQRMSNFEICDMINEHVAAVLHDKGGSYPDQIRVVRTNWADGCNSVYKVAFIGYWY